ncbi:hypothetical protein J6K27_003524 [Rhodococcus qingshengii]|uniref:hypothetical protein n=1 Tax=Rhodococcus qingshengii TaxID=334542 RepID=UPI001AEF8093|nr:hypothetical protein [Rhodococcus qingshengii]QTR98393.1 hypothetical protein J6K27_003524 [Rhodococcus qingshengii]
MSVTADQIEAVAEHVEAVHLVGAAQQLRGRAAHVRLVESQPAEVVELAAAIRNAYYNDGVRRELLSSRDPGQWLRMAVEAKSALDAGAVGPRVFERGSIIPDDVQRVVDTDGDVWTRRPNGEFSLQGSSEDGYMPSNTDGEGHGGDLWGYYLPLTEVLDEPKPPTPRVFHKGDEIPDDVTLVRTADDQTLAVRLKTGVWRYVEDLEEARTARENRRNGWSVFGESEFPLTEVLS